MGRSDNGTAPVLARQPRQEIVFLQVLPVPAAIVTLDERILSINAPMSEWLGVEAHDLAGRRLDEFAEQRDALADRLLQDRLLAGDLSRYSVLQTYHGPDGKRIRVKKSVSVLRDAAGEPEHCLVLLDEQLAHDELTDLASTPTEPAATFQRLVEALPLLVWTGDETGRCTYVNARWRAFTGICADAPLAHAWHSLLHPEDLPSTLTIWEEACRTARPCETRFRLCRHDGIYRWVRCEAVPWQSAEGGPVQWLGCCIDIHEEVLATEALRITSQRFDLALRSSPLILFTQDRELRYTWIYNPSIGFETAAVLGRTDAELLERAEEASTLAALKQSVLEKKVAQREEVTLHHAGVPHVFDLHVEPLIDPEGNVTGVTCACVDVTERKAIEAKVRRSEEILRHFVEQAPAALAMLDRRMHYVAHSGRWLHTFGLSGEPLAGRCHYDVFPEMPERWREINRRALEGGIFSAEEDSFVRLSGQTQWLKWEVRPWRSGEGEIGGIVIFCEDITRRKQAEAALSGHTDRQALLLRLTRMLLQGGQDRAALARCVFQTLAGPLQADFFLNYAIESDELHLVEHGGLDDAQFERARALKPGEALCGLVAQSCEPIAAGFDALRKDPRGAFACSLGARAYACHPLLARDGRLLGILSIASRRRDGFAPEEVDCLQTVCHFLALAWERLQSEEQLAEADRKKNEFIATLAHELRNPLTPILSVGHLLGRSAGGDPKLQWGAEVIVRQVGHVMHLVEDLLDITRITQGKLELHPENVSLAEVLRSAVENDRTVIEGKRHHLQLALPDTPLEVRGDRVRLVQIFQNLLDNAAKYTPEGGKILLEAHATDDGHALVQVSDNGLGIEAESVDRLFELFYQIERCGQPPRSGLGIGLTLVKRLVAMHGGEISVRSEGAGCGSTFSVRLPLIRPTTPPSVLPVVELTSLQAAERHLRILIVDDNPSVAQGLAMLLELEGYEVHITHDGTSAVEETSRLVPDIVLLDLGLPDMSGLEVARQIRASTVGRKVLLVAQTGWAQDEDRQRTEDAGFDAYFAKPIDPTRLLGLLEELNRSVQFVQPSALATLPKSCRGGKSGAGRKPSGPYGGK